MAATSSATRGPPALGRDRRGLCPGAQRQGRRATDQALRRQRSEFERTTISSEIDERGLREIYLPPFEAAKRAGVWAVMTAYNKVNGATPARTAAAHRDPAAGGGLRRPRDVGLVRLHSTAPTVKPASTSRCRGRRAPAAKLVRRAGDVSGDVRERAERARLIAGVGAFESVRDPARAGDRPARAPGADPPRRRRKAACCSRTRHPAARRGALRLAVIGPNAAVPRSWAAAAPAQSPHSGSARRGICGGRRQG